MKARLVKFGQVRIAGQTYDYDIVIAGGAVSKRRKGPSKAYREQFNHTPLSVEEDIPWGGKKLIIGTGVEGRLPIMPEVYAEAIRRGVEIVAVPTEEACALLREMDPADVHAILHITC